MSKKVLILSGSPRKGGNSDLLCDEFMRGAVDAGNNATKIRPAEKKIGFCSACYYCRKSGVYQLGEIKKSPVFKQAYEMGKSVR